MLEFTMPINKKKSQKVIIKKRSKTVKDKTGLAV